MVLIKNNIATTTTFKKKRHARAHTHTLTPTLSRLHTLKVSIAMRVAASRTSMGLSNILEHMDAEMSRAMRILLLLGSTASKLW